VTRSSGYEAGARCYGEKAEHTTGVGAEVAWIERARIESRALGRPNEALETLTTYEQRFPNGTFASEARLSRIELLAAVGRREEALRAIAEAAPLIPERAGSLHLLGARLALETNACALAEQHLDAAARAQAPADRIDALRRSTKCFAGPSVE
jgi:tetratricopeptide (TPR) repeat protein